MICPCGSETRNCHKNISTQTCHCHLCSGLNQETCEICDLQIPSVCLANDEVLVGEDVQPNTCKCFFSTDAAMDASEETDMCGNKTEPTRKTDVPEDVCEIQTSKRSEESPSQLEENANTIFEKQDVKNGVASTPEFSYSSDGYVLTPDEQSDGNIINDREMSSGSGEDSKCTTERKELSAQNLNEIEKNSPQNELAEESTCEYRKHSADESVNKLKIIDSNNNPEAVNKICSGKSKHKTISTVTIPFYIETLTVRPSLPRPFPQYSRPALPVPKIPISIPGRFSNLPRIRMNIGGSQQKHAEGQQAQTGASPSLSKEQLNRSQKLDSEITPAKKTEIIESWLNEVECSPPDEPSTTAGTSTEGHEQADDLDLSEISSDSKSSTELSEEENRRQRLSRRPPRTRKKSKK